MAKVKSIEELIRLKEAKEKKRNEVREVYIKSIDSNVKYKMADRIQIIKAQELGKYEADAALVYDNVVEPNLKDRTLQDAYGCNFPMEIVDKLFDPSEVVEISLSIIGQRNVVSEVDKEIKNS